MDHIILAPTTTRTFAVLRSSAWISPATAPPWVLEWPTALISWQIQTATWPQYRYVPTGCRWLSADLSFDVRR